MAFFNLVALGFWKISRISLDQKGLGYRFYIKVVPQSSQNKMMGWQEAGDGSWYLKVQIKASPEKGRANEVLVAFLAKEFGIRQNAIRIEKGQTARLKLMYIEGTPFKDIYSSLRGNE